MFSLLPFAASDLQNRELTDREMLRLAIMAELDAINLYEQIASVTEDIDLKKVMLGVAKEEKTHVGEFQAMLLRFDEEQAQELEAGGKEAGEITAA
ncbi:MAG: hypothetical protein M0Z59_09940 [Nitrospiraceae bacterium]|nr:hypothetical protein [Nitrospiraceae bacterium]